MTVALVSLALASASIVAVFAAAPASLTVQVDQPGHSVSPTLWGIFFEDINHSADGGLYAELVRNWSFEDAEKPEHWTLVRDGAIQAEIAVDTSKPTNPYNRRQLKLRITEASGGKAGIANGGYWGIALNAGAAYTCTFHAAAGDGFTGALTVSLQDTHGATVASQSVSGLKESWAPFQVELRPDKTDPQARLVITASQRGTVWLDQVSLMPKLTWKNHGLRPDLAEMLDGLKPAFVRFPGGCWVEGHDLRHSYRWKETIGDRAHRIPLWNIWQYQATHGIGYHEYLQLCEDLGAEPLFVINCGMSHTEVVPMDQMGPLIQDALDAVEYANGPATSVWGAQRARNGHAAPFDLKYLEIGNENGGPAYHERYAAMAQALKARYPNLTLVANEWGGIPTNAPVDIVDEHYYNSPEFFLQQADRYDTYDRRGPKIYVGEYAVTAGCGQGNLRAAIGEAAFMLGMERNSDVVIMASYAPLFVNINHRRWNPDLINFDSSRAYGIPSYYAQQMFSEHRGDRVLPVRIELPPQAEASPKHGKIGLGTWLSQAEFKDLRVTQGDRVLYASKPNEPLADWTIIRGNWQAADGALRQTADGENVQAHQGDPQWSDYVYTLKARKLGGAEGFLILFHVQDDNNWVWWNLGGWGNREHGLELCENGGKSSLGSHVPGRIETDRWYDVRVELDGRRIKCFLDNQLIHDTKYPVGKPLHAAATRVEATGEVIVKVVNASTEPVPVSLNLRGAKRVAGPAQLIVLSSASPNDENSLAEPTKVAPRRSTLELSGPTFTHTFPGNSLTILRTKAD